MKLPARSRQTPIPKASTHALNQQHQINGMKQI